MKKIVNILVFFLIFQISGFSQSWQTMTPMPVGLTFPVVVALNGEIHVIGGGGTSGATDLHLRYTPATNLWDTLAPVPYLAQQPAGAVLYGKIHYFGGGFPNSGTPLDSHYEYDPGTNVWTAKANLTIPRVIMEAAVLNGKLYAIGGQPDKTLFQEYDTVSNSWTTKNALPDQNFWYSTVNVVNGEMFRFGGGGYTSPVNYVSKYNSSSDSWTNISSLPQSLHALAGTAQGNYVFVSGGYHSGSKKDVLRFNVNTLDFDTVNFLPSARDYHDMVTIDSCIYVIGGDNPADANVKTSLIRLCSWDNVSVQKIPETDQIHIIYSDNSIRVQIPVSKTNQCIQLELFDLLGKRILAGTENLFSQPDGEHRSVELNIPRLPDSIYLLRLNVGGKMYSEKISVNKQ